MVTLSSSTPKLQTPRQPRLLVLIQPGHFGGVTRDARGRARPVPLRSILSNKQREDGNLFEQSLLKLTLAKRTDKNLKPKPENSRTVRFQHTSIDLAGVLSLKGLGFLGLQDDWICSSGEVFSCLELHRDFSRIRMPFRVRFRRGVLLFRGPK